MSNLFKPVKYSEQTTIAAGQMRREDYKAVKHMDKTQLVDYLTRIYNRGYHAGYKAAMDEAKAAGFEPVPKSTEG